MTHLRIKTEPTPLMINLSALVPQAGMSKDQFYTFCQTNRELRIERSAQGEVVLMSPAFSDTGNRNLRIAQQVANWADQDGTGEVFDSSTGFTLPNGAIRSPDLAWIKRERWDRLSDAEQASFAPICPDVVVELRSASDPLASLQEKLEEYLQNGVQLGVLIDRTHRTVHLYRPGRSPTIMQDPEAVSCDPELPGFTLQMDRIG